MPRYDGASWGAFGGGSGDITRVGACLTGDCGIEGGSDIFPILQEGTPDGFETTISVTDPTADRAIVFPNAGGTVALLPHSTECSTSTGTLCNGFSAQTRKSSIGLRRKSLFREVF